MRKHGAVDEAQRLVRDAVLSARFRGRTVAQARAEVASLFGLAQSRIWTFLYRPHVLNKISEMELAKIRLGMMNVWDLEENFCREEAAALRARATAMREKMIHEEALPERAEGFSVTPGTVCGHKDDGA